MLAISAAEFDHLFSQHEVRWPFAFLLARKKWPLFFGNLAILMIVEDPYWHICLNSEDFR